MIYRVVQFSITLNDINPNFKVMPFVIRYEMSHNKHNVVVNQTISNEP